MLNACPTFLFASTAVLNMSPYLRKYIRFMGLNEFGELQPAFSDLVTGLVMMVANR